MAFAKNGCKRRSSRASAGRARQQQLGRRRLALARRAARCSRTTCTSGSTSRTSGIARASSSSGEGLDVAGVSLPGVPADRCRQQRPCRLGIHEQLRRFPGPHSARTRPGRGQLPHARRAAQVRTGQGDDRGRGRRARDVGGAEDDLGTGDRLRSDVQGHALALAWTAHRPGATDMRCLQLERAHDLDAAAAIIGGAGMPGQNVMIADRARPHRLGALGPPAAAPGHRTRRDRRPGTAPGAGWDGWIPRAESPRLLDPPEGYRLERERAGRGRRSVCADRRWRLRIRGARAPDP